MPFDFQGSLSRWLINVLELATHLGHAQSVEAACQLAQPQNAGGMSVRNSSPRALLRIVCRTAFCLAGVFAAAATSVADDDADDEPLQPGLPAFYTAQVGGVQTAFHRHDALPTFLLSRGESPDSRLPAAGWRVSWKGLLLVKSPGKHHFSARSSGTLVVRVDGNDVVSLRGQSGKLATGQGQVVELGFGSHPLEISFIPQGEGAELKVFWQSEDFPREPLPIWAVGHTPTQHGHDNDLFLHGRLLVEEHSCVACHKPSPQTPLAASMATRPGPRLTEAGARLKPEWIYSWLGNPQEYRPEAVMPRLFSNDRRGDVERYAVTMLLTSRGKMPLVRKIADNQSKSWPSEGQSLFETIGCAVCHTAHTDNPVDRPARATLKQLGEKTTPEALAAFLHNPGAVDPAGRMPALTFANGDDPFRLALYLIGRDATEAKPSGLPAAPEAAEIKAALLALELPAVEVDAVAQKPIEQQAVVLGRRVMRARRCTACHEMKVPGEDEFWKPLPAAQDFASIAAKPQGGCLDRKRAAVEGGVPVFGRSLDATVHADQPGEAIAAFLRDAVVAPGTPAPEEFARLTLARFNCTGCHERNGTGGLPAELIAKMLVNQSEQNAESVSPPPLTGVAGKLLRPAIKQVLEGGQRSRPWMALQMPRFDARQLAALPAALAAAEGEMLHNEPFRPAADEVLIEAGRTLVGEKGFSCTKCHDMLGIASLGTRGPELARVAERINYDWYVRWMTDPQRLQPGTRMPTVFFGGKSSYTHILDGIPDQQRRAVWQYLLVCRNLPYPDGLRAPQKLRFPDSEGVQVVRTFLPESSARGIAIRSPDGLHLAYDAQSCRLSYAWTGQFLDMQPVWEGRGGNQASIDGTIFWTAPAGFPWEVTPSAGPIPDFTDRGSDTSLGAIIPQDGKLHPTRLDFRAVHTHPDRTTFDYVLDLGDERRAAFTETVATFRQSLAIGVRRTAQVAVPRGQFVWLNVGWADRPPDWVARPNESGTLDAETKAAPAHAVLKIVQGGKRFVVHLRGKPDHAEWLAVKRGDRWSVVLRLISSGEPAQSNIDLAILKPVDDDPTTQDKVVVEELGKRD